jgi:Na+/proline symporter
MENIDLKRMWQKAHLQSHENISKEADIEEIIRMNHSKNTAKVLFDIKLKIISYSALTAIDIGLLYYALVYLGLNLSLSSILPLVVIGIFFLIQTTIEINRLIVFTRNTDNLSVKDSLLYFRRKLNQMKTNDFLSYLVLSYLLAIWTIRGYIRDIGGFQNLSVTNGTQFFILFIILILLLIPWFLKYQNNLTYKKIDSELRDSVNMLNEEA